LAPCRIRLAAEGEFGMAPWSSARGGVEENAF
jgi:hypothetical protein